MRNFTIKQYIEMSKRFNRLSFSKNIITIRKNIDILHLAADGNWWGVKVRDTSIEEHLVENGQEFIIANEWGSGEMIDLVLLLGIDITDI